jgi:hypothetical protein
LWESKNALCNFPEFSRPPEKETYLNVPVLLKAQAGGDEQKTLFIALADVDTIVNKD